MTPARAAVLSKQRALAACMYCCWRRIKSYIRQIVETFAMNASDSATEAWNATHLSELSWPHRVAFVCIWVTAFILNSFCSIVVGAVVYKKSTWPNILLFVLTIADETVVVLGLSPAVATVGKEEILWETRGLCTFQAIVINAWYLYSFLVALGISLDRYLAVCHPFTYNKELSHSSSLMKGILVLIVVGVLVLFVSCLSLILNVTIKPVEPGLFCFFDWTSRTTNNRIVALINISLICAVVCVLLFFTMATCFGIYKMVQSARKREGDVSLKNKATVPVLNDMEVKFAKLAIVIVILFAACNLPFVVRGTFYKLCL